MAPPKKEKRGQWELESLAKSVSTLEDLKNLPVFRASSDDKGHSTTISFRCPEWLSREFAVIKEAPGSPYDIASDAWRDAAYIGHIVIQMRQNATNTAWPVKVKISQIIDELSTGRRLREEFKHAEDGLDDLCKSGETGRAIDKLNQLVLAVLDLPESDPDRLYQLKLLAASQAVRNLLPSCDRDVKAVLRAQIETTRIREFDE